MQTKLLFGLVLVSGLIAARAQTTTFTYQGRLDTNGVPASGSFDFHFSLHDAASAGNLVSSTQFIAAVSVNTGLFNAALDFGSAPLDGSARWLQIGVRPAGGGAYSLLSPRQQVTSSPYAVLALRAATYTGTIQSTNLSGTIPDTRLSTNVALLNTNVNFTGTVKAALFNGDGTGLTNVPGRIFEVIPTGTNIQAFPNFGYLCTNDSSPVIVTLPASMRIGETVRVSGSGAGGWFVAQNAGQSILSGQLGGGYGFLWRTNDSSRTWRAVAMSVDGAKMVAVVNGGNIYTSTNRGVSWTARASALAWRSVASSADGVKLVAVVNNGQVWNSANSGVSWTARDTTRLWTSVASSLDGTKMVATVDGGNIYTSTSSGDSWTPRATVQDWSCVASSATGSNLVAGIQTGNIYTSSDSGVNWISRGNSRAWVALACSSDGSRVIGAVSSGQLYLSTDFGVTWNGISSLGSALWTCVASSADGSRLGAAINGSGFYISEDSGANWVARPVPSIGWQGVAFSSDASTIATVATSNPIYVSDSGSSTTGVAGGLIGTRLAAVELEYVGNGKFMPISYVGTIRAK